MFHTYSNNELVPMSRRYPPLRQKNLAKDSRVAKKLIQAWDIEDNEDEVFKIFMRNKSRLSDYRYWELLRSIWVICGGVERQDIFRMLFRSDRKQRHYFSTPEESEYLRELPDEIEVWRATNCKEDRGISWTLSMEYALWYKNEFEKEFVIKKTIPKDEVFAYINRNGENEILIV